MQRVHDGDCEPARRNRPAFIAQYPLHSPVSPARCRPTDLSSGFYKDTIDYSIFCGEWCIGRIYETRTGSADLRWFWALHIKGAGEDGRSAVASGGVTTKAPKRSSQSLMWTIALRG